MARRPVLASLCGTALGIVFAYLTQTSIGFSALLLIAVAGVIFTLTYFAGYKSVAVCLAVFSVIGFLLFSVNLCVYEAGYYDNAEVEVTGVLTDDENVLRDCKVDGKSIDGKIEIDAFYLPKGERNPDVGDVFTFRCKLGDYVLIKDGVDTVKFKNGIRYRVTEFLSDVYVVDGEANLGEKIRLYVKDLLGEYLSDDAFGVAYAMLLGDKSEMDSEISDMFSNVGIAHIFAVSGLHIGFVVMLVNMFVKRRRKLSFALTMSAVFCYASVCGFPPSVLRAMIMTGLMLFLKMIGRQTDLLSSVAFAANLILIVRPFYLFDVSFQMSVGAVLGICLVTRPLNIFFNDKLKDKPKFVKNIVSSLCVSIGATLGTSPFLIEYFGGVSFIGVFFNVIMLPLVSVLFMFILLSVLIPPLALLLPLAGAVLEFVIDATSLFSEIPQLVLPKIGLVSAVVFIVCLFVAGGYLLIKNRERVMLSLMLFATLFCCCMFYDIKPMVNGLTYFDTGGSTFAVACDNDEYLFCDLKNFYDYEKAEEFQKAGTIELFVLNYENINENVALTLAQKYKLRLFVIGLIQTDDKYYSLIKNGVEIKRLTSFNSPDFSFSTLQYLGSPVAVNINFSNSTFTYVYHLTAFRLEFLRKNTTSDFYLVSNFSEETKSAFPSSLVFTSEYVVSGDIYSTQLTGNFTLSANGGKITFIK